MRRWALRIVPAVIAIGASLWWISGAELLSTLRACRPLPMLAALLLQFFGTLSLGPRWRAALNSVGAKPLPTLRAATVLSMRSQVGVVLAPGGFGADALRGYESGYGREMWGRLAKVAFLERAIGGICLASLAGFGLLPLLPAGWRVAGGCAIVIGMIATYIAIGAMKFNFRPVAEWTLVVQLLCVSGLAVGLSATGTRASLPSLFSIAAVAAFASMVPLSINGYGLRELALAVLAPRIALDPKSLAASGLIASTIFLAGTIAAALAARFVPVGPETDEGDSCRSMVPGSS